MSRTFLLIFIFMQPIPNITKCHDTRCPPNDKNFNKSGKINTDNHQSIPSLKTNNLYYETWFMSRTFYKNKGKRVSGRTQQTAPMLCKKDIYQAIYNIQRACASHIPKDQCANSHLILAHTEYNSCSKLSPYNPENDWPLSTLGSLSPPSGPAPTAQRPPTFK